uniref:Uncharacterized protein n=1 Tax=Physcomitrium patens TaxID=3218 RepID=A0A2K1IVW2_PHYPA|nr:hypothetical protein PHYPA_025359 [Physcomitrium patens]
MVRIVDSYSQGLRCYTNPNQPPPRHPPTRPVVVNTPVPHPPPPHNHHGHPNMGHRKENRVRADPLLVASGNVV